MPDEVAEAMKGLGERQRMILLWLGKEEGMREPKDLRERWPQTESVPRPDLLVNLFASWAATMESLPLIERRLPHAPYMEDAYFDLPKKQVGIRWSARACLGRAPEGSESATLSRGLRNLAERGLVELTYGPSGRQVTHVTLTWKGGVAAVKLQMRANPAS